MNLFRRARALLERVPTGAHVRSRSVDVGWVADTDVAGFIWSGPERSRHLVDGAREHLKNLTRCPSVIDTHQRLFVVPCPIDLHLRIDMSPSGTPHVVNVAAANSSIAASKLDELLHVMPRPRWRHRDRPLIQIGTPYRFVADEPVWMSMLPPFLDRPDPAWPGLVIPGRLPIHLWPRIMVWAFEWHDLDADLIVRRGDPWFMVQFESTDPERRINLGRCVMTSDLREFCNGLDGVAGYVSGTSQLTEVAEQRRPAQLLVLADQ